jgi:hypothetical protein
LGEGGEKFWGELGTRWAIHEKIIGANAYAPETGPNTKVRKIAFFAPYVTLRPPFVIKMSLMRHLYLENEGNKSHHIGYKIMLKHSRSALSRTSVHKTHNFAPQLLKRPFFEISLPRIQNYVKTYSALICF